MSSPRRLLAASAAVTASAATTLAVGLVAGASPASAAPSAGPTALVLTIAQGENPDPVSRAVVLGCAPVRGSHPDAAQACAQLAAVAGEVSALSEDPGICTFIYAPVTVTLRGVWEGRQKFFRATYSNSCILHRKTGAVFNF